ncbi:MAG: hypothetical protein ABIV47_04200 [Roseiflexaceae bacterium]
MTAHVTTQASPIARSNLLRYMLRGDALVTLAIGAICLVDAQPLATLIGIQPPLAFEILGAVLVLYGAFLFYTAARAQISRRIVIAVIALDLIWVIDSAILLVSGWLPLTSVGMWTIGLLAVAVAVIAELTFFGLRRLRNVAN